LGGVSWRYNHASILRREGDTPHVGACHHSPRGSNRFSPDPLTDLLRSGARKPIEQAVESEPDTLIAAHAGERIADGRVRPVRNGHLPEREVRTGIGPIPVKVPRLRDRGGGAERIRFSSSILPPYPRKVKSVGDLLPRLYLKGISTGDFREALSGFGLIERFGAP